MSSQNTLEVTTSTAVKIAKSASVLESSAKVIWGPYWDTLGTEALLAGAGMVSGLLSARLLGPQGRGLLAAIVLWPMTITFLCSVGTDSAVIYFAGRYRKELPRVIGTSFVFGGAQCVAVILVGLLVVPIILKKFGATAVFLSSLFLLCGPLTRAFVIPNNLLLGTLHTKDYNLTRALPSVSYTLGILYLFVRGNPSIPLIICLQLAGYGLAALLAIYFVFWRLKPQFIWSGVLTKELLHYGIKGYPGDLAYFMNQQLDQLLMSLFLPSAKLGIYVAAVAISRALLIVPDGIGLVTLASGSNSAHSEAWQEASRSLRLAGLFLVPAALALWLAAPVLIPLLLGKAFVAAVFPCRILIIGTVARGLTVVIYQAARGINHPEVPSYAESIAVSLTALFLFFLLKPYGAVGAAIASAVSYSAALIFAYWYFRRVRNLELET